MTLWSRLRGFLSSPGSSEPEDPDRLVELATVQPFEAPMIREVLAQQSIGCQELGSLTPGTWVDKTVLQVRHADLEQATALLLEFRNHNTEDR